MSKAKSLGRVETKEEIEAADLGFIAIPMPTYKAMSDIAALRGLTFAQALRQAIEDFINKGVK